MEAAIKSQSKDPGFNRRLHVGAVALAAILVLAGVSRGGAAQTSKFDPGSRGIWITGRVLDDEGRPIGNATVSATTPVVGNILSWALRHATRTTTDMDGGFALVVPFADIRYSIFVQRIGWGHQWLNVMGKRGAEPLEVRLKRGAPWHTIQGSVVDDAGEPVAGASVDLVAEYGYAAKTKTGPEGRFAFRDVPDYIGQGVMVARSRGLVGPIPIVRAKGEDLIIRLGKPGKIVGRVTEKGSGTALAGVTVGIGPVFANDFRMKTASGQDGTFELTGVPPGEYGIWTESSRYFSCSRRGIAGLGSGHEVKAGETITRDVEVLPVAMVRGQVLDRNDLPVTGAIVGIQSSRLGDYREQYRFVATDKQGKFALWTAHINESLTVEAFDARHGLGVAKASLFAEVTLRLSGAARIHGVVTDPTGRPIPDVVCVGPTRNEVSDKTDEAGRFDLGLVSVRHVTFKPPRPPGPSWITYAGPQPVRREQSPESFRYYQSTRVEYKPVPDSEVELKATLEPAELLTIAGKVLDRTGRPVPDARLHLFAGNAENWYDTLHPPFDGRPQPRYDIILTDTMTDEKGEWVLRVVRESEESMKIAYVGKPDATRYSIVAEAPDGATVKFVKDVIVPEGQTQIRIDLKLDESPSTQPGE